MLPLSKFILSLFTCQMESNFYLDMLLNMMRYCYIFICDELVYIFNIVSLSFKIYHNESLLLGLSCHSRTIQILHQLEIRLFHSI